MTKLDINPGLFRAILIISGALSGGLSVTIASGKFFDGFKQGVITSGLNHLAHKIGQKSIAKKELNSDGFIPPTSKYLKWKGNEKSPKSLRIKERGRKMPKFYEKQNIPIIKFN